MVNTPTLSIKINSGPPTRTSRVKNTILLNIYYLQSGNGLYIAKTRRCPPAAVTVVSGGSSFMWFPEIPHNLSNSEIAKNIQTMHWRPFASSSVAIGIGRGIECSSMKAVTDKGKDDKDETNVISRNSSGGINRDDSIVERSRFVCRFASGLLVDENSLLVTSM
ncbi:hypothetical protein BC829DRAFT_417147 [Chytridium lagenaria]|nr:hypothetical protein BC829DRAFT_417147 [Chytridium lagenaria]